MFPTKMSHSIAAVFGSLILLVFLAGCSSDQPDSSPTEQSPTENQTSQDEAPRDDLVEERVVEWEEVEIVDDNNIRVTFWMGNPQCYGARSVVQETDAEIAVAIIEGQLPDAPDACTMEARRATMLLETQQPVVDRDIVPLPSPELDL